MVRKNKQENSHFEVLYRVGDTRVRTMSVQINICCVNKWKRWDTVSSMKEDNSSIISGEEQASARQSEPNSMAIYYVNN